MSEIEEKMTEKQGEGGGGSQQRRKRKSRVLPDYCRCEARTENGKRCEAAAMRNRVYCVFHDPRMLRRRRQLLFPIPYEHPDQVHWLLGTAVKDLREKKMNSKDAYALGYLVTLLMQNQPRVETERKHLDEAQSVAELGAVVKQWVVARGEMREKEEREEERD